MLTPRQTGLAARLRDEGDSGPRPAPLDRPGLTAYRAAQRVPATRRAEGNSQVIAEYANIVGSLEFRLLSASPILLLQTRP